MKKLNELEQRIIHIEERNKRVEMNKSWEGSMTRRALLMLFTYLSIFLYFQVIGIESAALNAVVPTVGFFLSTLTLPFFRKMWEKNQKNRKS